MPETIKHIEKVEIKNLWNRYDMEWKLNPDVNILAGINGSGKTTILGLIAGTLNGKIDKKIANMVENVSVAFNNGKTISFNRIAVEGGFFLFENLGLEHDEFRKILGIDVISTFDKELKEYEALSNLKAEEVKTELDLQIFLLQKKYLEYQINIGNKALQSLISGNIPLEQQKKIAYKRNLFQDTLDELFKPTEKQIDRTKNELVFSKGKQSISPYMLSSGEKQMVIILLTALVQDEKNSVMLLDEPEISLHTDWQEKLIQMIRNLNQNAQIIIATHSPSIVLEGWRNHVFEVSDIVKTK